MVVCDFDGGGSVGWFLRSGGLGGWLSIFSGWCAGCWGAAKPQAGARCASIFWEEMSRGWFLGSGVRGVG